MANILPTTLQYDLVLAGGADIESLVAFVQAAVIAAEGFEPAYWSLTKELVAASKVGAADRKGSMPENALEQYGAKAFEDGFEIQGNTGGIIVQRLDSVEMSEILGVDAGPGGGWHVYDIITGFSGNGDVAFRASVAMVGRIFRLATKNFRVLAGSLLRGSQSYLGPEPPLAPPNAMMMLVNTDAVAAKYVDGDDYWAQWDLVEYIGDGEALVSRGMDIVDETQFKALTLDRGMALGRAARAGLTEYDAASPEPEEAEMIEALDSYLDQVGYDSASKTLEFAAYLGPDEYLTPKDILMILDYLEDGTASGDDVEAVRVTFPDEETSRRQFPPLRDIGVIVQYLNDNGEWIVFTD